MLEPGASWNVRHYANAFEAPEALDLSGPLSRLGFQDPVYVIRAKSLQLHILKPSDGMQGIREEDGMTGMF